MTEKKKIEDYLHLYLGCEVECIQDMPDYYGWTKGMRATLDRDIFWDMGETVYYNGSIVGKWCKFFKPLLRPLSDMTHDELQECGNMVYDFSDEPELNNHKWQDFDFITAEQFQWLLKRHFDLFGLIDAGLALDKTKTPKP